MLEYLLNIYVLPIYAVIIGLGLIYLYDKFENKQYTTSIYFRLALVLYISTFASLWVYQTSMGGLFSQLGGGNSGNSGNDIVTNEISPGNNVGSEYSKLHLEQFKTGVPTF